MISYKKSQEAQRAYINANLSSMEAAVDNILNELWKLKRKVHNAHKDTHYDVVDLVRFAQDISMRSEDLAHEWGNGWLRYYQPPNDNPLIKAIQHTLVEDYPTPGNLD